MVTWQAHTSIEDTRAFMALILDGYQQGNHLFWGIEYEQKLVGTIDFVSVNETHKFAEIGMYFLKLIGIKG